MASQSRKGQAEAKRIQTEIENDAKLDELHVREIKTFRSWPETFETASSETKHSVNSALIGKVVVSSEYNLDFSFCITAQRYLGKTSYVFSPV